MHRLVTSPAGPIGKGKRPCTQRDANNRRAWWACCVSHSGRLLELVKRERRLGLDEDTANAQGWACGSRRAVRWRESASRMSCIVRGEGGSRQMGTADFVMFATSDAALRSGR